MITSLIDCPKSRLFTGSVISVDRIVNPYNGKEFVSISLESGGIEDMETYINALEQVALAVLNRRHTNKSVVGKVNSSEGLQLMRAAEENMQYALDELLK